MKSKEIIELVRSRITSDFKAISIDGSAFDSSQFPILMNLVDDVFWKGMRPFIREVIQHNWQAMHNAPVNSVDLITDRLMISLLKCQNLVFVHMPGVQAPEWPECVRKQFYRDVEQAGKWRQS